MANENLKNEILTNEQLDKVAGGHGGDRTLMAGWIAVYYGSNGERGKIIDTSDFNSPAIVSKFCSKVGIDYRQNSDGYDE
ncbi:MAG: hypothetical protein IJ685_06560, partial [Selenomonadaceae bacterium]|nr:hypothetical protein [Selenomonadaceae bacterium]